MSKSAKKITVARGWTVERRADGAIIVDGGADGCYAPSPAPEKSHIASPVLHGLAKALLHSTQTIERRISDADIEAIENAVGMSHGGWDSVNPRELISAILDVFCVGESALTRVAGRVSHERAREAAQRLINSHFKQEPRARASIPADPERDDDLVICDYIEQQKAATAAVFLEKRYPCDGNGDEDAHNAGWNEAIDAMTKMVGGELRPMSKAPKDGTPVLLKFKSNHDPEKKNRVMEILSGRTLVGANRGDWMHWSFAELVGMGGFIDDNFEGWLPLPASMRAEPT